MRRSILACSWAVSVVACGVDYRVDQAEYNRRLCALSDAACAAVLDASTDGGGSGGSDAAVDGGMGGSGGSGGAPVTGGFGGLSAGGAAGSGGGTGTGGTAACTPGAVQCDGANLESCPSGTWISTPCQAPTPACENGACVVCVNGSGRCTASGPELCTAHAWVPQGACTAGTICQSGHCVTPPSCVGLAADCGSTGDQNCCATELVPGGTYYHDNLGSEPATISDVMLDRYEVTVGRFRKFLAAYATYRPTAGSGALPKVPGSGWDPSWTANLPVTASLLAAAVKCNGYATWSDTPGTLENRPINCLDWYLAFAFCAWDGARLPTDTEWNYAAAGGVDQRIYPWGDNAPGFDATLAIYSCYYSGTGTSCSNASIAPVGSAPAGNGKWGHADLAGNVEEWVIDSNTGTYPSPCNDCALLSTGSLKSLRGGYFSGQADSLQTSAVNAGSTTSFGSTYGVRCARTP